MTKCWKRPPALAKPLQPKTEPELGKLKTKLANAGFRSETAGSIFLGLKFAGLLAGLFLGGGTVLPLHGFTQNSLMMDRRRRRHVASICPTSSSG